jgi:hypothetical protein
MPEIWEVFVKTAPKSMTLQLTGPWQDNLKVMTYKSITGSEQGQYKNIFVLNLRAVSVKKVLIFANFLIRITNADPHPDPGEPNQCNADSDQEHWQ